MSHAEAFRPIHTIRNYTFPADSQNVLTCILTSMFTQRITGNIFHLYVPASKA
jgi:hypothetical protein